MMFCPKCGGLLLVKNVKNQKTLSCSSCKYVEKDSKKMTIVDNVDKQEDVAVVDQNVDMESLPEIEETCPSCGNDKGRYWIVQTRASDEAPTKFIKCEKCGHTWRDYS